MTPDCAAKGDPKTGAEESVDPLLSFFKRLLDKRSASSAITMRQLGCNCP
jgi:hypothetical protein